MKAVNNDVLDMGAKVHDTEKAVVSPDKTKVISLHHTRADHMSGFDNVRTGDYRSVSCLSTMTDQGNMIGVTMYAATLPDGRSASRHRHKNKPCPYHQIETGQWAAECLPRATSKVGHVAMKIQAMASQVITKEGQEASTVKTISFMQQTPSQMGTITGQEATKTKLMSAHAILENSCVGYSH